MKNAKPVCNARSTLYDRNEWLHVHWTAYCMRCGWEARVVMGPILKRIFEYFCYSAYMCTRQSSAWHRVMWTRCALLFPLFPTFLLSVPLLVVIWSYPEQGYCSATGHFVWLVRSPGTAYHCTFIQHLHYQRSKTCSRHVFSRCYFTD